MGRKAPPTDDDARIWEKLTETVRPLSGRQNRATRRIKPPAPGGRPVEEKLSEQPIPVSAPQRAARDLAPSRLDPNETRKIRRGHRDIEARLDLHGSTAAAAHRRLVQFIESAQAKRLTWVIVITGKGVGGKGVLRQSVPEWLSTPPLKSKIVGFETAQPAHGGGGALYVRLRRKS